MQLIYNPLPSTEPPSRIQALLPAEEKAEVASIHIKTHKQIFQHTCLCQYGSHTEGARDVITSGLILLLIRKQ